jgi:hypothetical protein
VAGGRSCSNRVSVSSRRPAIRIKSNNIVHYTFGTQFETIADHLHTILPLPAVQILVLSTRKQSKHIKHVFRPLQAKESTHHTFPEPHQLHHRPPLRKHPPPTQIFQNLTPGGRQYNAGRARATSPRARGSAAGERGAEESSQALKGRDRAAEGEKPVVAVEEEEEERVREMAQAEGSGEGEGQRCGTCGRRAAT